MSILTPFSCYMIGNTNLVINCAEAVLNSGNIILGVVSKSPTIRQWFEKKQIPTQSYISMDFFDNEFDYLFSIVNDAIIPKDILQLPRILPINYHDAPLPKYAGLYATSWAIMNGEREHAISWHIMEESIDAGDILEQSSFPIMRQETALTLNLKCYQKALSAFELLIKNLQIGKITRHKQDPTKRSYYGAGNALPNLGVIDWTDPAKKIDSIIRALSFGDYPNEIGMPKVRISNTLFIIKEYALADKSADKLPGTIIDISEESIQIATGTVDIVLTELLYFDGRPCPISQLVGSHLHQGSMLSSLNFQDTDTLNINLQLLAKNERYLVKSLQQFKDNGLCFTERLNQKENTQPYQVFTHDLSIDKYLPADCSNKPLLGASKVDYFITAMLIYLYRINDYKPFSFVLDLENHADSLSGLLSYQMPFNIDFNPDMNFTSALQTVSKYKELISSRMPYYSDIWARYPELKSIKNEIPLYIVVGDSMSQDFSLNEPKLIIHINDALNSFTIRHKLCIADHPELEYLFNNMAQHIVNLLKYLLKNRADSIHQLQFLTDTEQQNVLLNRNNTDHAFCKHKTIHQLFEEQVAKTPNLVATSFEGQTLTYAELNEKANQLAHFLRAQGFGYKQPVALILKRSLDILVGILAVMKYGSPYLPIDPGYPEERIAYMVKDSKTEIILTNIDIDSKILEGYSGAVIPIQEVFKSAEPLFDNPQNINLSEDGAYIIYTSGTTGNPKGVLISHRSAHNHMNWMASQFLYSSQDVFLQKTPFSFDASVWEFIMPILVGAKVVIAPDYAYADPNKLKDLITEHGVTILQLVPSMLNELLQSKNISHCNTLRYVFCGGEVLPPKLITKFYNKLQTSRLVNLYGPTESTIDSTYYLCQPTDGERTISIIGKPIMNISVYVLDKYLNPTPVGIAGELHIGGEGLAIAYIHKPQMTKDKFIQNPFVKDELARLYKTGDIVCWQSDGQLQYVGRKDDQVKVRGFRIELGEIETHINKMPNIEGCIVQPYSDTNQSASLAAYIVLSPDANITSDQIRAYLSGKLPQHMIPSHFFRVSHFNLTSNGKVDRKHIPDDAQQLGSSNCVMPKTDTERHLAKIWGKVLGRHSISIYDNFFDLGGHSLSAIHIMTMIEKELRIQLGIAKIFECQDIYSLSLAIDGHAKQGKQICQEGSSIIELQKGVASRTPLFLIHPVGGGIFWYFNLKRYLDKRQPLYGIQDPALINPDISFGSLEDMASTYIVYIQKIQPSGPYKLGGASFGSTVAIEMARQLTEKGESVSFIGLFDGWSYYPGISNDENKFKQLMKEQNFRLFEQLGNSRVNLDYLLNLQWDRERMLIQYKLPTLDNQLTLFKAAELTEHFNYDAPYNWWEAYSKRSIECYMVPGNHETIFFEPNVQTLAKVLDACLLPIETQISHVEGRLLSRRYDNSRYSIA